MQVRLKEKLANSFYDFDSILTIFRVASYSGASLTFLLRRDGVDIRWKLTVVVLLCVASIGLSQMYRRTIPESGQYKSLLLVEYIGLNFILLPTGGIASPFVWCILNPMVNGICCLPLGMTTALIFVYYFLATWVTYTIFNPVMHAYKALLHMHGDTLFSFAMVAVLVKLMLMYQQRIGELNSHLSLKNDELLVMNEQFNRSIDEMMLMDQFMENSLTEADFNNIIREWIALLHKWTDAYYIRYYKDQNDSACLIDSSDTLDIDMSTKGLDIREVTIPYNIMPTARIEMALKNKDDEPIRDLYAKKLKFVSKLLVTHHNRINFYSVTNRQYIVQEKNRIADELHDRVSQKLFSISCGLYALKSDYETNDPEISNRYEGVVSVLKDTVVDLRESIYGMSTVKQGISSVVEWLGTYVRNVENIHEVNISLTSNVDERLLTTDIQKSIYRICSEGISNSIKHGLAKKIDIELHSSGDRVLVEIKDNGRGFNMSDVNGKDERGLGLRNIDALAKVMNGIMEVDSRPNEGTELKVVLMV